jgi:hypothetical protein
MTSVKQGYYNIEFAYCKSSGQPFQKNFQGNDP